LVKQPIEYLVGAARALRLDTHLGRLDPATGLSPANAVSTAAPTARRAAQALSLPVLATAMAQAPFNPPNVGGWGQNSYWLDSATAQLRLNAALVLARRADLSAIESAPASGRLAAVANLLGIDGWRPTTAAALAHQAAQTVQLVALALTAPEYVLA
jgi:hypothetical protein